MAQEKIHGISVSDETIESWAAEAEAGYPVELLRKRGRKSLGDGVSEVIPVRMDQELLSALAARAEVEHVTRSEAIRAAVRDWVNVA
jgi:predicted transcriptional regulator